MKEKINNWIKQIDQTATIPSGIIAFNFGLYETSDGYCIYLVGSKVYDENDDDWACSADFQSDYLTISNDECHGIDWNSFLDEVTAIVTNTLQVIASNASIFSNKIITIGFDDGDLKRLR